MTIDRDAIERPVVPANEALHVFDDGGFKDIITEVDGEKVKGMEEVAEIVNEADPGDEMELTFLRDGDIKKATVTLGERPDSIEEPESE